MKILFLLFVILGASFGIYLLQIHIKKINRKAFSVSAGFAGVLILLLAVLAFAGSKRPDGWCGVYRESKTYPPMEVVSAMDYFELGNYQYDTGDCDSAVKSYSKSIELNGNYPQSLNNRAFTLMRMQRYQEALDDLDAALVLNPNYINALMNRGDIRNYYFNIDKQVAIADYEKIISFAGARGTSVCGHLFMARNNPKNPITWLKMPFEISSCRGGLD